MQARQRDRRRYFEELAATSRKYYLPWLSSFVKIGQGLRVLEIGCGEGGNLLPFAQAGGCVMGVDLASGTISDAGRVLARAGAEGELLSGR